MARLTKTERLEIERQARYDKSHRPWRDDSTAHILLADIYRRGKYQAGPDRITAHGQAALAYYREVWAAAPTGQGGTPCDRCGKPVEAGRYNVCASCDK